MRKNEPSAVERVAGPIPFYDLDGQLIRGYSFLTASGEVFVYRSSTNAWVAANADAVELGGVGGSGQFQLQFTQAETNFDTRLGVKLHSAVASSGSITTTVTTGGGNAVYTRSAGSYVADGFRVGHVVNWTGLANPGNDILSGVITVLTPTQMTIVLTTQVAEGPTAATSVVKAVFADQFWWVPIDTTASQKDMAVLLALHRRRSMLDGGAGSANIQYDAGGVALVARLRVFASDGALAAAVAGHANNADGETHRYRIVGTNDGSNRLGVMSMVVELEP